MFYVITDNQLADFWHQNKQLVVDNAPNSTITDRLMSTGPIFPRESVQTQFGESVGCTKNLFWGGGYLASFRSRERPGNEARGYYLPPKLYHNVKNPS